MRVAELEDGLDHLAVRRARRRRAARPGRPARAARSRRRTARRGSPRPGVIALPIRISSEASGPKTRPEHAHRSARRRARRAYGCWRPSVRGPTPTSDVGHDDHDEHGQHADVPPVAERARATIVHQHRRGHLAGDPQQQQQVGVAGAVGDDRAQRLARPCAPRARTPRPAPPTPAPAPRRRREQPAQRDEADRDDERDDVAVLGSARCRRSPDASACRVSALRAASRCRAPRRPCRRRGADRLATGRRRPVATGCAPAARTSPLLVRLGVVVAEQVQDAVRAQQVQLGSHRVARACRLLARRLPGRARRRRAAPRRRRRRSEACDGSSRSTGPSARPSGTPCTSVGPGRSIQCTCSSVIALGVEQQDRQLGQRVDAHRVEDEPPSSRPRRPRRPSTPDSLATSMLTTAQRRGFADARASTAGRRVLRWRPSARRRRRCRRPAGGARRRRWVSLEKCTSSTPSRISRTTRSPLRGRRAGRPA